MWYNGIEITVKAPPNGRNPQQISVDMTAKIYNLDDYRKQWTPSKDAKVRKEHTNDCQPEPLKWDLRQLSDIAPRRCTECNRRAPAGVTDESFFAAIFQDCAFCSADCLKDYDIYED